MIRNSFVFLPHVRSQTEQRLWDEGIGDWDTFLHTEKIKGIHPFKKIFYDKEIKLARQALYSGDSSYFVSKLPKTEMFRLFDFFREDALFLDIETTSRNAISVIGISDGFETKQFVHGMNFQKETLRKLLLQYKILITFNGSSFDVPIMNKYFQKVIPAIPHIDLRHVCARLGLTGGLKKIEVELGITRELSIGEMFYSPMELWDRWHKGGEHEALDELLAYNEEDAVNLKYLMNYCYDTLKEEMIKKIDKIQSLFH